MMNIDINAPIIHPGQKFEVKESSVVLSLTDWQKVLVLLAQNNQVNIIDQKK